MKAHLRTTASAAVLALIVAGAAHAQDPANQPGPPGSGPPDAAAAPVTAGPGATTPANPQSAENTDREGDNVANVDTLIVTAQKREQRLQDVPVVITSLNAQTLENAGVRDIKDLQILTPGLTVTSTSNETITTARIRGVGTVGDNPGLESSVGVSIDGVYRPRNGVSFNDLGEIERIEVLKGPQGTLFGTNTSAGVINVITKGPSFTPGVNGEFTGGNYGQYGGSVSVTGPIVGDQLAGRLFFSARHRDGFYDVVTGAGPRTQDDDQNQNFWTARGQLLWQPNADLSVRLIGDYTQRDEDCCVAVQIRTGPTAPIVQGVSGVTTPAIAFNADPYDRTAYANRDTTQKISDKGLSGEINYKIPGSDVTVTSITAYRQWHAKTGQDSDFTAADIIFRPDDGSNSVDFKTFSQELRFAGNAGKLDWLVGGFFANEDLTRRDSLRLGTAYEFYLSTAAINSLAALATRLGATPPSTANGFNFVNEATGGAFGLGKGLPYNSGTNDTYDQNSKTYALFTNDTFHITDQLELTGGLRYTWTNKDADSQFRNLGGPNACAAMLANQSAIAGALIARGVSPAIFGPGDPRGPALVATTVGTVCLPFTNPLFNGLDTSQSIDEHRLTGTAKLVYHFSRDLMTYASYARGYKSGGFNLDRTTSSNGQPSGDAGVLPVTDTRFAPELVDSYELGFKSTLANRSLLFNATVFYQKFTDFQLNTFLGTQFIVDSIPKLTTKGVDADVIWFAPVTGLTFQGGVTYADTKYGNFTASELTAPSRYPALSLLPGSRASFAPKWSLSGTVNWEHPVAENLKLLANVSAKYMTDYNTGSDLSPFKVQDGYGLVNARIGLGSVNDLWTLELWAQNLTNTDYYQVAFNGPIQGQFIPTGASSYNQGADTTTYDAFLGQPRTFGATLRVKWGG